MSEKSEVQSNEPAPNGSRTPRLRRRMLLLWLFLASTLCLTACDPLPAVAAGNVWRPTPTTRINDPNSLVYRFDRQMHMRGDSDFSLDDLSSAEQLWHERLLEAANNSSEASLDAVRLAESDNAYHYGRGLYTHNHSLLLGLRVTGDLRFLDEVDRLMQVVRDQLSDDWCDDVRDKVEDKGWYNEMRGEDGFLNFRRRNDDSSDIYCRDIADLEEALVHGHLAMVMYAYHVNRDLDSPAGVDYGERADFWLDYLLNHFEEKWRERSGRSFPRMDFIDLKFCHTFNTFLLYYYYVGMRLDDEGDPRADEYLEHARIMTDMMFETPYLPRRRSGGFVPTPTPLGEAVVYSFGAPGQELEPRDASLEACPTTYARYMVPSLVQLRLESFYRWDDVIMSKIATGLAHFVFDTSEVGERSEPFAAGVTGDETIERIPRTEYRERFDEEQYLISSLANIAPWNDSGRIREISEEVYERIEEDPSDPANVHLPASFLLSASLQDAEETEPDEGSEEPK